jgi:acyl-CoA synthetase (AMP-forming)/AMP-acid ligase II
MAGGFAESKIQPGERVGLLCPNAPEFLQSLFGIMRLGAAVCPLPTPVGLKHIDAYLGRLERIAAVAGIKRLVISHRFEQVAGILNERIPGLEIIVTSTALAGRALNNSSVHDDGLAIVQFTSGSTANPKGVGLTHGNVLAGSEAIAAGIAVSADDRAGFWLPLFHDMGLFGTLTSLLTATPVTVWSPLEFVKRPGDWLRDFIATRATITASPNFGYEHLVAAVPAEEVKLLGDMSHWRIAGNGAESIAADSTESFLERFAPAGFRPETMFCIYGMAEATLAVTFPPLGRPPLFDAVDRKALLDGAVVACDRESDHARLVANLGAPVRGMELRLADADGRVLDAPAQIGEIQLRGSAVMSGYLDAQMPAFTPDGWLPTGDLGYLRGDDLHITGRVKEMITVRGVNFYPDDVESLVRTVPGVYKRRCVAFADTEHEKITLVAETALSDGADRSRLLGDLRGRIQESLGFADVDIRLFEPTAIPRTTSGKLQRLATRELLNPRHD